MRALGVRAWGDITMTDAEKWNERRNNERRNQVARYRLLAQETTDPLAAALLRDIVSELEADPKELVGIDEQTAATDNVQEVGVLEFHERTVSCLVRNLSEHGAALGVIRPRDIPDRFTLALPSEGTFHLCRLIWRSEAAIGVTFQ
jgi:hypothetical protein